ncbi:MAG: transferrin-binding protein-like solute binding protein [Pseudomonadota bacterium]
MTSSFRAVAPAGLAACLLAALAACGGGGSTSGTPTGAPVLNFVDPYPSDSTEDLAVLSLNTAGTPGTTVQAGTFDQNSDEIQGTVLAGDTNSTLTFSDLNAGGEVEFSTPNGQSYSRVFDNTGNGGSALGVIGMVPRLADMPGSNVVNYSGASVVTIADGTSVFDLAGTSSITADFGAGTVNVTLGNLDGIQQTPGNPDTNVNNVTTITITGATIAGTGFSGGAITATNGVNTSGTQSHDGSFFGNGGVQEAGGVLAVDGASSDILGLYLANRN